MLGPCGRRSRSFPTLALVMVISSWSLTKEPDKVSSSVTEGCPGQEEAHETACFWRDTALLLKNLSVENQTWP